MTNHAMPAEIRVIQDGLETTRYILPRRRLGALRWLGLIPLIIGLGLSGFMSSWITGALAGFSGAHGFARYIPLAFALFGLPGLAVGAGALTLGILIIVDRSHSEIIVADGYLRAVERAGILRWTRQCPIETIRGIRQVGTRAAGPSGSVNLAALNAFGAHAGLLMAAGYPESLLAPLAHHVSATVAGSRLATDFDPALADQPYAMTEADGLASGDPLFPGAIGAGTPDNKVAAPPRTRIVVQEQPGGVAIAVPAAGLWKGSKGLIGFALFWNAFVAGFVLLLVQARAPIGIFLFMLIFVAIGLGALGAAIQMGRKRVLLAVAKDALAYQTISPFGTVRRQIPRPNIASIRIGPSGMSVGNKPVLELQIHLTDQRGKTGLLSQCTPEELAWVAAVLRRHLGIPGPRAG